MNHDDDGALYRLLMLVRHGGCIVGGAQCSAGEIALAKARGHFHADRDGHTYVYRPPGSGELAVRASASRW